MYISQQFFEPSFLVLDTEGKPLAGSGGLFGLTDLGCNPPTTSLQPEAATTAAALHTLRPMALL
jgi:hypothetical protein